MRRCSVAKRRALALLLCLLLLLCTACGGQAQADAGALHCTVRIECSTVLAHMDDLKTGKADIVPSDGVLLPETTVAFSEGGTVFDVLQQVCRAQGIHIETMKVIGLGISNGRVALAGGLMTQYQGTADVSMGRGAVVIGLAAIIIGEVLCDAIFPKGCNFAIRLLFVVFGGVIYYAVMVIILWLKLDPNDLKLFTAIIVAIFLAVPHLQAQAKSSFAHLKKQGKGRG